MRLPHIGMMVFSRCCKTANGSCHFFFVSVVVFAASAAHAVSSLQMTVVMSEETTFCLLFSHDGSLRLFRPLELGS